MWQGTALLACALMLSSCGWRGISNMSIPGVPGSGGNSYTVYAQMPDTLALNGNSRVLVADVWVGSVRAINLNNWVPTLTLGLDKSIKLPKNTTAKIGQTSLLGSQHVELAAPQNPSPQPLKDGDTIPLNHSSTFPSIEQVLASLSLILRGGGVPNVESLTNEVYSIVKGRAPQIRALLGKLDTFTDQLNQQRDDINHAIDSANRLLSYVGSRADVLDRVFAEAPPLIKHLADPGYLRDFINASDAVGRLSAVTDQYVRPTRGNLHQNLQTLQCPLKELVKGAPYLPDALKWLFTVWPTDAAPKSIRGDYINLSFLADLTYSATDNAFLTGTGFSGALRALEQSFGHDPEQMIPDVRYTPNPNDAPGGQLIERGDRNC
ncbi:virulence factor Mce family protein [Candidatus Mycobacterium methanotrophicum]|uniref:Virulence factor Mce family protein n=1 Tax=Candidatus Mycobacterium methanotrophicum TaxID=2943498 RepID=A0ABY4QS11_9MYCO|nr:virulence factor Mce family protein [Candidatus Mycobacterium methanotrophicum]UQX13307.1 virulence factor Mce family protein [Candidatus Mycobacterium methanotrophicum]